MVNSDLKILFCGMLKSPFIEQDLELLSNNYNVTVINLDIVQESREGFIIYIWSILTQVIFKLYETDIVYIWFVDYHTFPLLILSKIFGKRNIITVGGWEVSNCPEINYGNQLRPFRGSVTRWCLRHADVILVPSYAYKRITKLLEPTSNIYVIPNAIDKCLCEHLLPEKSDKIVTALYTLKFTSVLKGIPTFEEASKNVPYECVIYEGIGHDILMDKLREAKVYCQLSYTESFGVTNLEAMACGCIPIVTDRDALPEIIGDTGIVVPYGDVDATVKAMIKAMTMDGSAARERSKYYTRETRIKMLSDVIENKYNDMPLVTVVIPAYNCANWLPDTIKSILDQSYPNIEIIVVDDCSTDNIFEVISQFKDVKYFKNDINLGECATSKKGFEESKGDYICRLSADDMYANVDKIKHQVEIMERTGADWSYNSINIVGERFDTATPVESFWMIMPTRYGHKILQLFDNYILKFPYISFVRLFFGNPVNSSTLMIRKSSYVKSVGWSDGNLRTDCDGFLLFNFFLQRFKCVSIKEIGAFYRIHPNQATNTSLTYKNDMLKNKTKMIEKVINGNYPIWLKFMAKLLKRRML